MFDRFVAIRVAELGSLSSGAKMAMKIFVKRVFKIFATNASFLRVILKLKARFHILRCISETSAPSAVNATYLLRSVIKLESLVV